MGTTKQSGIGQGKGGGRPRREGKTGLMVELPTRTAELLKAHAEATGLPVWRVIDDLVLVALDGQVPPPEPPPKLAPLALKLAQEVTAFLACHENPQAASKALRKAWERAILLADHDLKGRVPEG